MSDVIARLEAPAKLTLSLRVVGRRDDGYHLVDAEMVTVSLADHLTLRSGHGVVIGGEGAGAMAGPTDGTDLISAALRLVDRRVAVEVDKVIPPGAGLGGGSADAAAILRWAGFTDVSAAAALGADVSYCLVGGRARVTGIGEVVEPLEPRAATYTLLTPPLACSTPEVYAAWDRLGGPSSEGGDGNDLLDAALAVQPKLARYRDLLGDASGRTPRLAGSGSTWFVEGSFPGAGRRVVTTRP